MENYIFKQKHKIKGNETEVDLTNEKIGDKGLETLSLIEFEQIENLSLDDFETNMPQLTDSIDEENKE